MWFEAVRRDGSQARFTRTGHDWIERVLAVIEAKRCAAAQVRFVNPIMMRAHHRSRARGVLFENNKPDAAHHATSNDDTVLISGEPEARDIGGRDRIAEEFVISRHHGTGPDGYWYSTTKAPVRMAKMAVHIVGSQMSKTLLRVTGAAKGRSAIMAIQPRFTAHTTSFGIIGKNLRPSNRLSVTFRNITNLTLFKF